MNTLITEEWPGTRDLRNQLLDMISDEDLAYKLPGDNVTLGELCEQMGQIQQIYTQSFETLKQDWQFNGSKPKTSTVNGLKAWYEKLDAEMHDALSKLSEDDIQNKQIDRAGGFFVSPYVHFQIYREALLIFYAKVSIYLRALQKAFTNQWKVWIG